MKPYVLSTIAVGLLALGTASTAVAQAAPEDPFAAYEGNQPIDVVEPGAAPETAAPANVQVEVVPVEKTVVPVEEGKEIVTNPLMQKKETSVVVEDIVTMEKILEAYRFSVGGGMSFSYDRASMELLDGSSRVNSAFHTRLFVEAGMTVYQNVTVELTVGTMWRRMGQQDGEYVAEHDWVFTARGWYSYPIWARAALLGGVGLGGYFGSSEQPVQKKSGVIRESTKAAGFVADLYGGVGYILGDAWQLRMLANFNWMLGSQTVQSLDKSLSNNTTHIGLSLGVTYTF